MDLIKIKDIYDSPNYNSQIIVAGWVRAFRGNRFIELNDGSTIENIQCVISDSDRKNEDYKNNLVVRVNSFFYFNSFKSKSWA